MSLPDLRFAELPVKGEQPSLLRWYHSVLLGFETPETVQQRVTEQVFAMEQAVKLMGAASDGLAVALGGMSKGTEDARKFMAISKVPAILKVVNDELEAGVYGKIVILATQKDVLQSLWEGFGGREGPYHPQLLFEQTYASKRVAQLKRFGKFPTHRIQICQVKACNNYVNLTAAHEILIVQASYLPADNAQAILRVHQVGQNYPVNVRWANVAGTVDEKIGRKLASATKELVQAYTPVKPRVARTREKEVQEYPAQRQAKEGP